MTDTRFLKPAVSDPRGYDASLNKQTIRMDESSEVTLQCGPEITELLTVTPNDRSIVEVTETDSFKPHLRNFHVKSSRPGFAMLEARDHKGEVWAYMQIQVVAPVAGARIKATPSDDVTKQITPVKCQPAIDRLIAVRATLISVVKGIQARPFTGEAKSAVEFFGCINALDAVLRVVADQPGYSPNNREGNAVRDRMKPLIEQMDKINYHVMTTVDPRAPLEATAMERISARNHEAVNLVGILLNEENAADVMTVSNDRALADTWKDMFFAQLGNSVHEAMVEVLKTNQQEHIYKAVDDALDQHQRTTMIGGILWAIQAASSLGGNLPGPNSLYVGVVRIRALVLLEKAKDAGKLSGLLDEVLPHWFAALKFSDQERAAFNVSLGKFVGAHNKAVAASQEPTTEITRTAAKAASLDANTIYKDELKSLVESKGSPQSGLKLSGFLTILNLACLFALWKQSPELKKMALSDFANLGVSASSSLFGIVATFSRCSWAVRYAEMLGEAQAAGTVVPGTLAKVMSPTLKLANSATVGKALGAVAGFVTLVEGVMTVTDECHEGLFMSKLMIVGGVFQGISGAILIWGAVTGWPPAQLAGVIIAIAASLVELIADELKDKMVAYIRRLIALIKEATSPWDNGKLEDKLGLSGMMSDLETLVATCDVTEIAYDASWIDSKGILAQTKVHDCLAALGMKNAEDRARLMRHVSTS